MGASALTEKAPCPSRGVSKAQRRVQMGAGLDFPHPQLLCSQNGKKYVFFHLGAEQISCREV